MIRFISVLVTACLFSMTVNAGHHLVHERIDKSKTRSEQDKARDEGRQPAKVLEFLGVKMGMTTLDLVAAGGYYTEVLSLAVDKAGTVYAQNPASVLKFRDGANDKAITARLANNRLANVVRLDKPIGDTGIKDGTVDLAITALNFHDIHNGSGREAALGFSKQVLALLKPGGILGVIDHDGVASQDNQKLHRMQEHVAIEILLEAGFEIAAVSDMLRNPKDDHTAMVFAPDLRGKTDRFLIKARKPAN